VFVALFLGFGDHLLGHHKDHGPRGKALNLTHKVEHFPIVVEGVEFL
jgi:hypothetical protein